MPYQTIALPFVYIGTSTDTKPVTVNTGSRCYELDTGDWYVTRNGVDWAKDLRPGIRASFGLVSLVTGEYDRGIKGRVFAACGHIKRTGVESWGK